MLNPVRSDRTAQTQQAAQSSAQSSSARNEAPSCWDGASQKETGDASRAFASCTPAAPKKTRHKSLMERAGHLVEDKRSLKVPDLIGGLGLEAVALAARQQGLYWFRESDVDALLPELERLRKPMHRQLDLPEAYLRGFHGFSQNANLQYLHALNMEPAIAQFAGISLPEMHDANKARRKMLDLTAQQIKTYLGKHKVHSMLDVGCGTGVTTQAFGQNFPRAIVRGVDASDYMLAEAQRLTRPTAPNVRWSHALAQAVPQESNSVDVYAMVFMAHEQKKEIMDAVLKEAYRVLKPGGVLAISDYDTERPLVKLIAHAPGPVVELASNIIFEPHIGDYLHRDFEASGKALGFTDFKREKTCANVQLVLLRKPLH